MRMTIGKSILPPVRQWYRPTCVISWSRHGYENASYCISQTGRQPAMHNPTAAPRIPASASGVSTQRFSPKRSRSPAVARKTPPARPTSSPITITSGSRSSSTCRQSLTASTIESSATVASENPAQLGELRAKRLRRLRQRVLEEQRRVRRGLGLRGLDPAPHQIRRLGARLLHQIVRQHAQPPQV